MNWILKDDLNLDEDFDMDENVDLTDEFVEENTEDAAEASVEEPTTEEIKHYRRNHFTDIRTKTENIILESRLLEEWYRNADSGLRILFILGKTTDC